MALINSRKLNFKQCSRLKMYELFNCCSAKLYLSHLIFFVIIYLWFYILCSATTEKTWERCRYILAHIILYHIIRVIPIFDSFIYNKGGCVVLCVCVCLATLITRHCSQFKGWLGTVVNLYF